MRPPSSRLEDACLETMFAWVIWGATAGPKSTTTAIVTMFKRFNSSTMEHPVLKPVQNSSMFFQENMKTNLYFNNRTRTEN